MAAKVISDGDYLLVEYIQAMKYLTGLALLLIVAGALFAYNNYQNKKISYDKNTMLLSEQIIFEKDEWWGPCPLQGEPCEQRTKLYGSGRLVLEGNENKDSYLGGSVTGRVVEQIRLSGIMDKNCQAPLVLDYGATFKIVLDGREKEIRFPGCEKELKSIDDLFLEN
ncbi:MAG: hypothetical protein UY28_C0045G0005 [Candidatus Amesbacteria bacterium GW2011_GWB1_48_13]|uniref:Uncharacterized protein n=1 Tax=Candidatus Amesbacteria bacterium GW2011_GWB1_48_13 TaxID=1618362 RepID=A0A0G1UNI5_9BACT|nr:MAG: hypothetical protein UY28_C0045G0005 [Candidatus Amesbacteria bacterium GW2011_GWB1_48_13]